MTLGQFIDWLTATPLSDAIKAQDWIVPAVQTVHILGIAVLMGTVLIVDLSLVGMAGRSQGVTQVARRYLPWFWGAFAVLLVTGALMIIGEPARELNNPSFWWKMRLLVTALAATALFTAFIRSSAGRLDRSVRARRITAVFAILILCLWIGVIFAGRFIAYTIEY